MQCPQCGTENHAGRVYCQECGALLVAKKNHQRKQRHQWWPVLGVAILLVIAGLWWVKQQSPRAQHIPVKVARQSQSAPPASAPKPAPTPTLPTKQLQQIAQKTVLAVPGTNSIYVKKFATAGTFVANNRPQRAASVIKLFIMATAFQQIAAGKFSLNEPYTLTAADKVGGSGVMQGFSVGTKVTLAQVMQYMMDDSDNVASNIMLAKVGGLAAVNAECRHIGTKDTIMARKLMDMQALAAGHDNMTSVADLGKLLSKLYQHRLVSPAADTQMLALLAQNKNHTKLPAQLTGAKVYNKTGEFGDYGVQNDAAIIANDHGAFVAVVLAQGGAQQAQIQAQSNFGAQVYAQLLSR